MESCSSLYPTLAVLAVPFLTYIRYLPPPFLHLTSKNDWEPTYPLPSPDEPKEEHFHSEV